MTFKDDLYLNYGAFCQVRMSLL